MFASKRLNRLYLLLCCTGLLFFLTVWGYPAWKADAAAFSCNNVTEIPASECQALVAFYNQTNGPGWTNNSGWLVSNTPCSWYGISCSNGHVSQLQLDNNLVNGFLPSQLGDLTALQTLRLDYNQLKGTIPAQLGALPLQSLDLENNQLSGTLPAQLGNLTHLTFLNLLNNQLSGSLPAQLGNLVNLHYCFVK